MRELIGDLGNTLGFEVILNEDEENDFDCIWKSSTGFYVVIKEILSEGPSEETDKLCSCIWKLINKGKIPNQESTVGLYIVRNDATKSELINSIIAKKQTRQLRVITFEELWDSVEFFYPIYYRNEKLGWSAFLDSRKKSADTVLIALGLKVTPDAGSFINVQKRKMKVFFLERLLDNCKR